MPRTRPACRKAADAPITLPMRRALLPGRALPSPRWKRVTAGYARPLGILPELAREAGIPDIPTALRQIADAMDADAARVA